MKKSNNLPTVIQTQTKNFHYLMSMYNLPSRGTCPSIKCTHIALCMSLTHWVMLEPKCYAQILHQCLYIVFSLCAGPRANRQNKIARTNSIPNNDVRILIKYLNVLPSLQKSPVQHVCPTFILHLKISSHYGFLQ